jgi:hypothetical protein
MFQTFGEAVSDARRAGDAHPNKNIIAETNKLDGNSSYGKTVTNKERHTDVISCSTYHFSKGEITMIFSPNILPTRLLRG